MKKLFNLTFSAFPLGTERSGANPEMGGEGETCCFFSVITYDKNDKMLNTGNGFFRIRRRTGSL